jgi:hypothetical protein
VIGKDFVAEPQADVWLGFQFEPVSQDLNSDCLVAAILKPGITVAQANAQLMVAIPEYRREFPNIYLSTVCRTKTRSRLAVWLCRFLLIRMADKSPKGARILQPTFAHASLMPSHTMYCRSILHQPPNRANSTC